MREISILRADVDHAECVAWDPAGKIVFGTEGGEIRRYSLDSGDEELLSTVDGFVLGLAVDGAGDVHACVRDSRVVIRCGRESAWVESRGADGWPLLTPNYPAFHPDGSLYVSDSGSSWEARNGVILRVAPDGSTTVVSRDVPAFPNGLAVDATGDYLYVLESSEPRLSRLAVGTEGLGRPELVVELPGTVPDGIALTADGAFVVSCYKPDALLVVRDGVAQTLVEDWQGRFLNSPTNVCFFGRALDRLAATNLGARTIVEVTGTQLTGIPLHYPRLPL